MSIKTILVPLGGVDTAEPVLDTALSVARRFDAHLEVLHIRPNPREAVPYLVSVPFPGQTERVIEAAEKMATDNANTVHQMVEQWCARNNIPIVDRPPSPGTVSVAWREEVGHVTEGLVRRARVVDLIFIARPIKESHAQMNREAVLMETGRPLFIVPPANHECRAANIAIGWNGSAEAARAVVAAMPFLRTANSVTVITSPKGIPARPTVEELVEHLAWHSIKATVERFDAGSHSIGEALLAEAGNLKADLLVVGGYGHTRARELILGGATFHVLTATKIPVIMAH